VEAIGDARVEDALAQLGVGGDAASGPVMLGVGRAAGASAGAAGAVV